MNDYMQTNDLDYASDDEKAEYERWSDLVEAMLDGQEKDVLELQQQQAGYVDCYDDNPDDECMIDCREEW